jgi:hypothetical protein
MLVKIFSNNVDSTFYEKCWFNFFIVTTLLKNVDGKLQSILPKNVDEKMLVTLLENVDEKC